MTDFLALPERSAKPRTTGVTHVLDKGLGPNQVSDLLAVAAGSIDIVKLGWGTAAVTTDLPVKVAVYRDAGMDRVREVVRRFFRDDIAALDPSEITFRDHKTALQEMAQADGKPLPVYRLLSESGPDHEKVFVFEVEYDSTRRAVGEGHTKKEAQRRAARNLLEALGVPPR